MTEKRSILILTVAAVLLVACELARSGAQSPPSSPTRDPVAAGCLDATAEMRQFRNVAEGYCFLYPSDYELEQPSENSVNLFVGSMMDVRHPKLFVEVTAAPDQTAEQVADQIMVEYAPPGFEVERSFGVTVDNEPAARLENMPGQDISRQVIVVHDGRAYHLTFTPADPSQEDVYRQMEALYTTVINSFRFLPGTADNP